MLACFIDLAKATWYCGMAFCLVLTTWYIHVEGFGLEDEFLDKRTATYCIASIDGNTFSTGVGLQHGSVMSRIQFRGVEDVPQVFQRQRLLYPQGLT